MTAQVAREAERLGGLKRIVLGHSHTDHRGTAPYLGAPVFCHPDEVGDCERNHWNLDYWDHSKLEYLPVRIIYPLLHRRWDGGPVEVAGTLSEGDEVAGFEVIDLSGHSRGLIALWRERDRVVLVSDAVYCVDSERLKRREEIGGEGSPVRGLAPTVPHPAFNFDTDRARAAVRKLADLGPRRVWTGHAEPLEGEPEQVAEHLRAAAQVRFARE